MIFNGVHLPDEVRIALEEDRLVIFAGAGVSMPPPSGLPSFHDLACTICGGKRVTKGREDQFLGKQARDGTDVHAAAAQILFHDQTHPTALHREILRLFGKPEKVRIVTTNFDDHFSAAAKKLFGKNRLRELYAPALPLGDEFTGLVYLHGSARVDPRSLVLTDKDFGAAYLTRGWARDFLVPLFSKYTVLFVGYSHGDVTMRYLARGLNQSVIQPRWAMVPSDIQQEVREDWDHLEISVAEYPIAPCDALNPHQALTDFCAQWVDHTEEPLLSRAKRVRAIARGLPPETEAVSEYLSYCLSNARLAEDLCNFIRHPAWVGWMHNKGYFKVFFGDAPDAGKWTASYHPVLAKWLCSYVRRRHPDLLLALIQNHHQRLSRSFSQKLAHVLWVEHSKVPDPRFSTWVSILLSQGKGAVSGIFWGYLLTECRLPTDFGVAVRLFELLTTPEIQVEKSWDYSSLTANQNDASKATQTKVHLSIKWPDETAASLVQSWEIVFRPHISKIADVFSGIVVNQLVCARLLMLGDGRRGHFFDLMNWDRSSIAPHEQDENPMEKCASLLVDILRDILLHWITINPIRARVQAEVWWAMNQPLLRRFTTYARSVDTQYNADENIDWILMHKLVFRSGMKKEVFDLLKAAYPNASVQRRRRLLENINRGYRGSGTKRMDPDNQMYEKFNVLVWLGKADEKCTLVQQAIEKIRSSHPGFEEREYPQFSHWHENVRDIDLSEGINLEHILSEHPRHYIKTLRESDEHSVRRDRWSYLCTLPALFARDRDWTRQFVEQLALDSEVDVDIWSAVFSALRETVKTSDDWEWVLPIIESLPHESAIYTGVANLVSHCALNNDAKLSDLIIDKAALLMDRAWALCSVVEEMPDGSYREWLTSAINHVGGWIGEFWVRYCRNLRQRPDNNWVGIPTSLQANVLEALTGSNRIKVYARISMTPWIGYFYEWDKEFCIKNFFPLLDWDRNSIVAQQTWSVLLNYNRGSSLEMEKYLLTYYQQFSERLVKILKGTTQKADQFDSIALQNLGYKLATLAMKAIPDPVDSGFFSEFLPLLPLEGRAALAHGIGNHLKLLNDEALEKLWNTWLRRYLDLRLVGIPVTVSAKEAERIFEWCLLSGPIFPDAVDRILKFPQKSIFAFGMVTDLLKSPLLHKFPRHACRLLIVALQAEEYPHLHPDLTKLHQRLKNAILGTEEIGKLEELLYLRGWDPH